MISIRIRAWALEVEVQSSETHPDALDDAMGRATDAFANAVATLETNRVPLFDPEFADPDFDE